MNNSESTKSIYKALLAAQQDIEHPKHNATNPHLKNKFADLKSVIDSTRPALAKHGLFVQQSCGVRVAENGAHVAHVTTRLVHGESGEWVEETAEMVVEPSRGLNTPQATGVIHTYLRRYQWSAICGVYSEPDTDGAGIDSNDNQTKQNGRRPFQTANAKGGNGSDKPAEFDPKLAEARCIDAMAKRGIDRKTGDALWKVWRDAYEADTGEEPGRDAYAKLFRDIQNGAYDEHANTQQEAA